MRFFNLFASIFFLLTSLAGQSIQDGLVFYAPFDGSTVNLVEWVKPRNHGASFTSDKFGNANHAIHFDGNDDYLDFGNLLNLGRRNFSVSLWVKTEGSGGKIINKGMTETPRGFSIVSLLSEETDVFNFVTSDEKNSYSPATIQTDYRVGQWQHLVVTRAADELQVYLNNELIAIETTKEAAQIDADVPLAIGAVLWKDEQTATDHFQGDLDEVRVYNRRLTTQDVNQLYEQFETGLEGRDPAKKETAPIGLEVTAYPNPTSHILNLDFTTAAPRKLRILDPNGRLIRYQKISADKEAIPVSGLPPGTYFLRIEEGDRFIIKRFLKVGAVLP